MTELSPILSPTAAPQLVLFDLDGTLTDSAEGIRPASGTHWARSERKSPRATWWDGLSGRPFTTRWP